MDTQSKASLVRTSPHLIDLFNGRPQSLAIPAAVVWLSAFFERPTPEAVQLAYLDRLQHLSSEQLQVAFSRAGTECKFWPSPAVLLDLAGVETPDQCSEREAREALEWVIWRIRRHGVESRCRQGALIREQGRDASGEWHAAEYEQIPPPATPEPIRNALELLGAGDVQTGVRLIAQHPLLVDSLDEYPTLGLRLVAIEKLEARWIEAWRKVNR